MMIFQYLTFIFFFFSSRRRHTRFKCDWSSDVCSSDLVNRNVLRGGANGLVANVQTIHFDTGRAAEPPAKGDRRETLFGGIEVAAVLDLHAGLELSQIQEITAVDGQILNLFLRPYALDRGLFRIH